MLDTFLLKCTQFSVVFIFVLFVFFNFWRKSKGIKWEICCEYVYEIYFYFLCPVKLYRQVHDEKTDEAAKLYMAWNNINVSYEISIHSSAYVISARPVGLFLCDNLKGHYILRLKPPYKTIWEPNILLLHTSFKSGLETDCEWIIQVSV